MIKASPKGTFYQLLLLGCLWLFCLPAAAQTSLLGPMLGAVEMTEARIWLQSGAPARIRLGWWPEGEPVKIRWTPPLATVAEQEYTLNIVLDRLRPGTRYRYRVELDGRLLPPEAGYGLTTQSDWAKRSEPPDLKIALGSCVYLNDPAAEPPGPPSGGDYQIFTEIARRQPQLMLWLGDNVYLRPADFYSRAGMSDRYRQLRALPELQSLLTSSAHYAIWDDHDYGDNDSNRSYRMRGDSLDLFRLYWPNPSYGLPEQPGIFTRFVWSDVEFILTDNRYSRAANELADPGRDYFGALQFQWLKDTLSSSRATFKLVAFGNQVLNTRSPSENFYGYQREYQNFLNWLQASGIPGVVLLSGDRHHSEFLRRERQGAYPLYEWTVSPLTSKPYPPYEQEREVPERVPGSLLVERNFGLIDVSGQTGSRRLHLQLVDAQGHTRWQQELTQQELK